MPVNTELFLPIAPPSLLFLYILQKRPSPVGSLQVVATPSLLVWGIYPHRIQTTLEKKPCKQVVLLRHTIPVVIPPAFRFSPPSSHVFPPCCRLCKRDLAWSLSSQCSAVRRSASQCIAVRRSASQYVAVCHSVLQCVTVCHSVLQGAYKLLQPHMRVASNHSDSFKQNRLPRTPTP